VKKSVVKAPEARPAPALRGLPGEVVGDFDHDGDLDVRLADLAKLELDFADLAQLELEALAEVEDIDFAAIEALAPMDPDGRLLEVVVDVDGDGTLDLVVEESARAVDEARRQAEIAAVRGAHARGAAEEAASALETVRRSLGSGGDEAGRIRTLLAEARLAQEAAEHARQHAGHQAAREHARLLLEAHGVAAKGPEDPYSKEPAEARDAARHEDLLQELLRRYQGDRAHASDDVTAPSHESMLRELLQQYRGSQAQGDMAAAQDHARRFLEASRAAQAGQAVSGAVPASPPGSAGNVPGRPGIAGAPPANEHVLIDRIRRLEEEIATLRAQLDELRADRAANRRDPHVPRAAR
jgi:hypothetical protein